MALWGESFLAVKQNYLSKWGLRAGVAVSGGAAYSADECASYCHEIKVWALLPIPYLPEQLVS